MPTSLPLHQTLAALPPAWPDDLLPAIRQHLRDAKRKLVVLDDDPTGTQTVHDIAVLTEWSVDSLAAELQRDAPAFYLLTNSRSLPLAEAQALNREIARHLVAARAQAGVDFTVVSRSDSTLRGHFPGETDALLDALGEAVDATLIIPFFLEGGRYTMDGVHYVAEGDTLLPAAQTPFAQDAAFGYSHSDLRKWVAEKTEGRTKAEQVALISLADLRQGGPQQVAEKLLALDGDTCVIDSVSMRDQQVAVLGILQAEAQGKRFLYRTAASFVQVRAGLSPQPVLTAHDLRDSLTGSGGLVIVGSYVPKTTAQLETLLATTDIDRVEIDVATLLTDAQSDEISRATAAMNDALHGGRDVVVYTSRELVTPSSNVGAGDESLSIGQRVSQSLVQIVRGLAERPRYLVAKGGITSSDVATQGLGVRRALVRGQILPGVPLWSLGAESRFAGMPYVVFPGNVGGDEAVAEVVRTLGVA